jgi:hypothetical protein
MARDAILHVCRAILLHPTRPSPRSAQQGGRERGAIAIEAAVILSVVLMPLLLGVLTYGSYFWQAQKAQPLAAQVPMQNIVGQFTCVQLVDRVKTTVQNALPSVTSLYTGQLPLDDIGVRVVNVLPTVGVDIVLSISVPAATQLGGLLPLPNDGRLLTEATYRLDNVQLTTAGC